MDGEGYGWGSEGYARYRRLPAAVAYEYNPPLTSPVVLVGPGGGGDRAWAWCWLYTYSPPRLTQPPFQFPFSLSCLCDTEYSARLRISHRKEVDRLDSFAYISVTKRPDPPHPSTDLDTTRITPFTTDRDRHYSTCLHQRQLSRIPPYTRRRL